MTDWKAYGEDVKTLREARGWSQGKLGHLANDISQSTIRDVERGQHKEGPHPDTIAGIQNAFGRNLGEPGYELTKKHIGIPRADAIAAQSADLLLQLIGQVPEDRRGEAAEALRQFISI